LDKVRVNKPLEDGDIILKVAWASVLRYSELLYYELSVLEGLYSYLRL
jgi:hypothetical protein